MSPPTVLTFGAWHLRVIPDGWVPLLPYGVWRETGPIPTASLILAHETAPDPINLDSYVSEQRRLLSTQIANLELSEPFPTPIDGADRALAITLKFTDSNEISIVQHQIFARAGPSIGIATLTTGTAELEVNGESFARMIDGISFAP